MKTIDVSGKPCPIPVIETKKVLAGPGGDDVTVKVDNIMAVQNLEKMAAGFGYDFSYSEHSKELYEVRISKNGKTQSKLDKNIMPGASSEGAAGSEGAASSEGAANSEEAASAALHSSSQHDGVSVVIGSSTMGDGVEELGKILIKGFIYSLTELPILPKHVIFLNSGAFLTSEGSNTIDDLKTLKGRGVEILTCGTCINYYKLNDKPAVGCIANMYEIAEKITAADNVINI